MMKRFYIILVMLLTAIMLCLVACGSEDVPLPEQFSVAYTAGEGGYIKGNETQIVTFGEDGNAVTAVPFDGYRFVKWLDNNSTTPQRAEFDVQEEVVAVAEFAKMTINVWYRPDTIDDRNFDRWDLCGGYVDGELKQALSYGKDADPVVAKPYAGYVFADWSDGSTSPERHDKDLTSNLTVSVRFVKTIQTFTYEYNDATANNTDKNIVLTWNRLNKAVFAIPERAGYNFQGWFLDEKLTIKLTTRAGHLLLGNEALLNNDGKLYAKWISEDILVYPVLMVFVTEIQATLHTIDGNYIDIDYKLSTIERKICELLSPHLALTLNDMLDGIVTFEVDAYFTTEVVTYKNFNEGVISGHRAYNIYAYDIFEVNPLLSLYRTVITNFGMEDNQAFLHNGGGTAFYKYASCHLDGIFKNYIMNGMSLEAAYTYLSANPTALMGSYTHEFTHTIELTRSDIYDYHSTANGIENTRLYLRYEYMVDGEPVGIPLSLWKGEGVINKATYMTYAEGAPAYFDGGEVVGEGESFNHKTHLRQMIPYGTDAAEVTAIAKEGYRFVKWSDGITSPTRHDKNVTSYLYVRAIFEKI